MGYCLSRWQTIVHKSSSEGGCCSQRVVPIVSEEVLRTSAMRGGDIVQMLATKV